MYFWINPVCFFIEVCEYSAEAVSFLPPPCSLLLFLPSCSDLSFTEIVNQLNALSCFHGDDDGDDDEGVHKQTCKAKAKPAASTQGLLFWLSFTHFSFLTFVSLTCEHPVTSPSPFMVVVFFIWWYLYIGGRFLPYVPLWPLQTLILCLCSSCSTFVVLGVDIQVDVLHLFMNPHPFFCVNCNWKWTELQII